MLLRIDRRTASATICSARLICPAGTTGFAAVPRLGFVFTAGIASAAATTITDDPE